MEPIKLTSTNHIPSELLEICILDGKKLTEIVKLYTYEDVSSFYKTKVTCIYGKFGLYLYNQWGVTIPEYFEKIGYNWPLCPITNKKLNYSFRKSSSINGLKINHYHDTAILTKKNSKKILEFSEKLSKQRMGSNNPAYGKNPWNKNKTKLNDPIVALVSRKLTGRSMGEESRQKMREARAKSTLKARHTTKHSSETILKLREHTARLHSTKAYVKTSSIHIKMREFLQKLHLTESFEEEFQIKYFAVDFAFPLSQIAIECDGDYFHSNPKFYPNGPETTTQKRNTGRDKSKNKYLKKCGWQIIRIWENEINSKVYEEKLICKLKKLNLLKA
jgi:very-short-patch-repair endonuclease